MRIIEGHLHVFTKLCQDYEVSPVGVFTFPIEAALSLMEEYGIEKAVLLQNPTIGSVNEEIRDAIINYPGKFAGTIQVDPFDPAAEEMTEAYAKTGIYAALKYELSSDWGWQARHPEITFSYEMLRPLIHIAEKYNLAIVLDTGGSVSRAYDPEGLGKLIREFPDVNFVIEHGGFLIVGGDMDLWHQLIALGKLPNVYFGISSIPTLKKDAYPCTGSVEELKILYDTMGPEKLIFGTDAPGTMQHHTYQQMIDWVLNDAPFLSEEDKEMIFYKNANKIYFKM